MKKPRRRLEFTLTIGADDMKGIRRELNDLVIALHDWPDDYPWISVSGGPDSHSQCEIVVDETVTHDSYMEQVNKYLNEQDGQS